MCVLLTRAVCCLPCLSYLLWFFIFWFVIDFIALCRQTKIKKREPTISPLFIYILFCKIIYLHMTTVYFIPKWEVRENHAYSECPNVLKLCKLERIKEFCCSIYEGGVCRRQLLLTRLECEIVRERTALVTKHTLSPPIYISLPHYNSSCFFVNSFCVLPKWVYCCFFFLLIYVHLHVWRRYMNWHLRLIKVTRW